MNKSEKAIAKFLDGFLCSQAVLTTYSTEEGLDEGQALKLATGFGGGIGRMGQACGAVTGAVLVIGLKKGTTSPQDLTSREKTYKAVRELFKRFKETNGSTVCRDLLGYDISVPEEYQQAKEKELFKTICPVYVKSAVEILEEVLNMDK